MLVAIVAILSGLGLTYRAQKSILERNLRPTPKRSDDDLNATAQNWSYTETNSNHTTVEITAEDFSEVKDSSRVDLKNVILKLYNKTGDAYDLVKSSAASLFQKRAPPLLGGRRGNHARDPERRGAEAHPDYDQILRRQLRYRSGQANTDRASSFAFENGTGSATGAFYDPASRVLNLKNDVKLDWKPVGPNAKPMKIEAGTLYYREAESEIWLKPWGRLTRDTTVVEGAGRHHQAAGE